MIRVLPTDVVSAYKATGLIPIRKAWESKDGRGGCAIDALARHTTDLSGNAWASRLDDLYCKGFTNAWDADKPRLEDEDCPSQMYRQGYWDAVLCRAAVLKEFASITPIETSVVTDTETETETESA